jgi:hypothetical protein
MNGFSIYDGTMWIVVIVFWAAVVLISRNRGRPITPNLFIVPVTFLLLGTCVNRVRMPWGTYFVCLIHVMLLPMLLRIAKSKP